MGIRRASIQTTADSTVSFQAIQPQTGGYSGTSVTSIVYTDNNYNTVSANAANVTYGNFRILGAGFISSSNVLIQNTSSGISNNITSSTTFIGSGEIRANVSASMGSNYNLYVYNSTGTAGYIGGLNIEPLPYFSANTLTFLGANNSGYINNVRINVYSIAVSTAVPSTTTFALASGNTLPSGLTLYSNGVISGNLVWSVPAATQTFSANLIVFNAYNQAATSNIALVITTGYPFNALNVPVLFNGYSTVNGQTVTGVAYSAALGYHVAVSWDSNPYPCYSTSSDGLNWTSFTQIETSRNLKPGTIFRNVTDTSFTLFCGDSSSNPWVLNSTNGISWSSPVQLTTNSGFPNGWDYSPSQGLYVAGFSGSYVQQSWSTDAITWNSPTYSTNMGYTQGLAWSPTLTIWIQIGFATGVRTSQYSYSFDGKTWGVASNIPSPFSTGQFAQGIVWSTKDNVFMIAGFNDVNSGNNLQIWQYGGSGWAYFPTQPPVPSFVGSSNYAMYTKLYRLSNGNIILFYMDPSYNFIFSTIWNGSTWTTPQAIGGQSSTITVNGGKVFYGTFYSGTTYTGWTYPHIAYTANSGGGVVVVYEANTGIPYAATSY